MATDVFNNPSNDYVNPGLAPCAGAGDGDATFEFVDNGAGIISGSNILQFMDLSNISVLVNSWINQKITLQSGEVIYIPGPDKGLLNERQVFDILPDGYEGDLSKYFMIVDLSISYYNNFRHYNINLEASSNYALNIDIDDALNLALANNNIKAEAVYDPSTFTFSGTQVGYDFRISNFVLTLIDNSTNTSSPFVYPPLLPSYTLEEDISLYLPAMKYPNGAMLGYLLKTNFPPDECYRSCWIYMNHVVSPFDVYIPETITNYVIDISTYQSTIFDPSIQWGPFVDDISINVKDVSCVDTGYTYDPSYGLPITYNALVDNSILTYALYGESVITNSIIEYSGVFDFRLADASQYRIEDSSVYGSDLYDNNVGAITPESYAINCFISDSSLTQVDVSGGFIQKSYVRLSLIENADVVCLELIEDSSVFRSTIKNLYSNENDFYESGIENVTLTSHGIYDSSVLDSSIVSSTVQTTFIENSDVSVGTISDSYLKNTILFNSYITDSSIIDSPIQRDTSIYSSTIQNSWLNAYVVAPGIWTDDVDPGVIEIHESVILDTSIYNATVYNSIIYTSNIYDSSLIGCEIYNSQIPDSVTVTDSSTFKVDSDCSTGVTWTLDTSTFYQKYTKDIAVGMNGTGDTTTLSGADYLDYINTHDLWFKVGPFASRISAPDVLNSAEKNLIGGFYLFNPQTFPVQVEYMLINYNES